MRWPRAKCSGTVSGVVLVADNVIGTKATEMSTEAITNSSKPSGSAPLSRSCPRVSPPMEITM